MFLLLYLAVAIVWLAMSHGALDPQGKPLGSDFISFWSASSLALGGEPEAAYDMARHYRVEQNTTGNSDIPYYAWFYPPTFLALALPLALLPYLWSLFAWLALSLAAYAVVIWRISPRIDALWLALAFPAVLINLGHGQNGFLSTALIGGAILLLDRRPLLAGVLIGLLAFKPQLGLLLPLALIAGGCWKTFISAAITSVLFVLGTLAVFGVDAWAGFFAGMPMASQVLEQGLVGWEKMQSTFAAVRLLGGDVTTAYAVQAVVSVLAAAAVIHAWRAPVGLNIKAAVLVTGGLLATPFVLDYDLVLLALPITWITLDGLRTGFLGGEKFVLLLVWLLPLISRLVAAAAPLPPAPLVIAALLLLGLLRIQVGQSQHPHMK